MFASACYIKKNCLKHGHCSCRTENHFPFKITDFVCRGRVFGHGCVSVCVVEGNRPLVSRFPPYLEIRADVVTSFLAVFLQYHHWMEAKLV